MFPPFFWSYSPNSKTTCDNERDRESERSFFIIMFCPHKSLPRSAVVFYFLGLEVPASSLREQFSVALTRAVGLCDPGIREVCLAGGR